MTATPEDVLAGRAVKLSPFWKCFGSKNRSADKYPPPLRGLIIEPFAGAAGYACNYPDQDVLLCDSDERVVRIWRYLIRATSDEIMELPLMVAGQSIDELPVSEDARLFLSCCVNTSAFRKTLTAWKNGQNDGLWGAVWRAKVARQVPHIKHWRVVFNDYSNLLNVDATWFIDPPYCHLQQHYRESARNPLDYARLSQWCRSRRGQTIVCEQEGANWLPFTALGAFGATRKKTNVEVMWSASHPTSPEPPAQSDPRQQSLF